MFLNSRKHIVPFKFVRRKIQNIRFVIKFHLATSGFFFFQKHQKSFYPYVYILQNQAHIFPIKDMFCFLVVGGGTSGSVIASRLSEDPDIRVLLLEAGKADDDIFESHVIDTPGLAYSLVGSSVDWKYETEPQQFCCGGLKEQVLIATEISRI